MTIRAVRRLPPLVVDSGAPGAEFALRGNVTDGTGRIYTVEWPLPPHRLLKLTRDLMAASEVGLIRGASALPPDPEETTGDPSEG